jgi:hypothetical protein
VLNLSNPTGATIADRQGVGTIRDDEPRIVVEGQLIFPEGDTQTTLQVVVNLSTPSSQPVTVSYATADGTAVAGSDYLSTSGTLVFAPGRNPQGHPRHAVQGPDAGGHRRGVLHQPEWGEGQRRRPAARRDPHRGR